MEKTDVEKMAFCCVLAVVGAIAITNSELTGDPDLAKELSAGYFSLSVRSGDK